MKYLENAFKFFGKYLLLSIPLLILVTIPNVIQGSTDRDTVTEMSNQIENLSLKVIRGELTSEDFLIMTLDILKPLFMLMIIAQIVSLVLRLIIIPSTYGVVNKALKEGYAGFDDFLPQLGNNLLKYIIYGIANFVLWLIISIIIAIIAALILFLFIGLGQISGPLVGFAIVISVLLGVVIVLGIIAVCYFTIYWFPAMVAEDLGVISALKKSIEVSKSYFWPTVGITLLISFMGWVVSVSVAFPLGLIPYMGVVVSSIPTAIAQFLTIVFLMLVYRDKAINAQPQDDGINGSDPNEFRSNPHEFI